MTVAQLAEALELDVYDVGICLLCLSFVAFPLDAGDEQETARGVVETSVDRTELRCNTK
jgi:hypothetical protein